MPHLFKKYKAITILFSSIIFIFLALFGAYLIIGAVKESHIHYAQPVGVLKTDDQPSLDLAISTFTEKRVLPNIKETHCSARVYGYDDKYIYGSTICAWYDENGQNSSGIDYGRYTYAGPIFNATVTKAELQGEDDKNPSLESLYPAKIYHLAMPNVTH